MIAARRPEKARPRANSSTFHLALTTGQQPPPRRAVPAVGVEGEADRRRDNCSPSDGDSRTPPAAPRQAELESGSSQAGERNQTARDDSAQCEATRNQQRRQALLISGLPPIPRSAGISIVGAAYDERRCSRDQANREPGGGVGLHKCILNPRTKTNRDQYSRHPDAKKGPQGESNHPSAGQG